MQLQYVYRKDLFMLKITRDVVIRVNLLNLLPSVAAPAPPQHECGLCPISSRSAPPSPSSNTRLPMLSWTTVGGGWTWARPVYEAAFPGL